MSSVFALGLLYEQVRDLLDEDNTIPAANVVFGFREAGKQINQSTFGVQRRVVFEPGDGTESGDIPMGDVGAPRYPHRNPRPIAQLNEMATIYVQTLDATAFEDERAQYEAARLLLDAVIRAIYLNAHGTFQISKPRWVRPVRERAAGLEARFTLILECPVPDTPMPIIAPPGVLDDQVSDATSPTDAPEIELGAKAVDPATDVAELDATDIIQGETP